VKNIKFILKEKGDLIMIEKKVPVPFLGALAATRGMLGAGAALLFLSNLKRTKRRKIGWTLFLTGLLSTIPIGYRIFHK
jgi:hypothetical protein